MTQTLGIDVAPLIVPPALPARVTRAGARPGVADRTLPKLFIAISTAAEVSEGLESVVDLLSRASLGDRVEWWRPSADGDALGLMRGVGASAGRRSAVPIGPLGVLRMGETCATYLMPAVVQLVPLLRRRWEGEQLVELASSLARRNEALQDFAALVAHELKRPLLAALVAGDREREIAAALDLVDSLLAAARTAAPGEAVSSSTCLDHVLMELGPIGARVMCELPDALPLSTTALRLVLRNLVSNAVAAGAREIHIRANTSGGLWMLTVDDDGVGLDNDGYTAGSGLGLSLTRRFLLREGATLRLEDRTPRGTRALVEWSDGR